VGPIKRRAFVAGIAISPVALAGCRRRTPPADSCAEEHRPRTRGRVLSPEEWDALEAITARIMPTDGEPGAREAHAVNYIDAQLALGAFSAFRRLFAAGLRQVNLLAQRTAGKPFAQLSAGQQDAVLRRVERGVPLGRKRDSRQFFRLLLTFTLEGFLCDPVYGGNRDRVGWRFIGFEPRAPRPRCPYRAGT
jgi:gluconate 2-dehydrogenase gamma chain